MVTTVGDRAVARGAQAVSMMVRQSIREEKEACEVGIGLVHRT